MAFVTNWPPFSHYPCTLFLSYQSDWQALRGALVGCLALLHRKPSVGTIAIADVKRLVEAFINYVQVQSLAAADRKVDLIL